MQVATRGLPPLLAPVLQKRPRTNANKNPIVFSLAPGAVLIVYTQQIELLHLSNEPSVTSDDASGVDV
jgi:hypothetical protein